MNKCPRVPASRRVIHLGDKEVFERTDPDYMDKRMSKLVADYQSCPKEWKGVFLAGLSNREHAELMDRLKNIKKDVDGVRD